MGTWRYRYTCSATGIKVYQFECTNQYMIIHSDGTVEYQLKSEESKKHFQNAENLWA